MDTPSYIPYDAVRFAPDKMLLRAEHFYQLMDARRSVRDFSSRPVPRELIEFVVRTACSAPSGANKQPWTFCLVGKKDLRRRIREAAEQEEYENYHGRMSGEWLRDLEPLGTDWHKPFLETAPWLIAVFRQSHSVADGEQKKNYYVQESVGIACGLLVAAIHHAGLACLTHTPSPMNFLQEILGRSQNEKPFLLIPVGYPADDVRVPAIRRKPFGEMAIFYE